MMNADKMSIEDLLSEESFIHFCKGTSTADTAFWEQYIQQNPGREYLINQAKEKYIEIFNALANADMEEQTARLINNMGHGASSPVIYLDQFKKRKRAGVFTLLFRLTVAAAAAAGIFFIITYVTGTSSNMKTYVAAYGERKNIQLPDGSIVTLNSGSSIGINEKYGTATRDVYLEGEAFFEVKHDTSSPFIVHTPAMDIKALGTAFDVKAYSNEKITETSLIRGLVEVTLKEDNNLKMLLYPNQKISWKHPNPVSADSNLPGVKNTGTHSGTDSLKKRLALTNSGDIKEIAWKANKLIFDDEEFGDIAVLLERWYGAKINFGDSAIRKYRFTGMFEKEDLNTVLDFLKESRDFNYTIERGETITINLSK